MRKTGKVLWAAAFVVLSGCGCLESWEDRNLRTGGGGRDPDQPEWHRCLFGTTWLPGRKGPPHYFPPTPATEPSETTK